MFYICYLPDITARAVSWPCGRVETCVTSQLVEALLVRSLSIIQLLSVRTSRARACASCILKSCITTYNVRKSALHQERDLLLNISFNYILTGQQLSMSDRSGVRPFCVRTHPPNFCEVWWSRLRFCPKKPDIYNSKRKKEELYYHLLAMEAKALCTFKNSEMARASNEFLSFDSG